MGWGGTGRDKMPAKQTQVGGTLTTMENSAVDHRCMKERRENLEGNFVPGPMKLQCQIKELFILFQIGEKGVWDQFEVVL